MNQLFYNSNNAFENQKLCFIWPEITKEVEQVVLDQLHSSISIYNKSGIFKEFEDNFAKYHNLKYACTFNSGTSAIHAMIESLNLELDDEIICPVYTFFATCSPAVYLGYKVVFCDSDKNGNIDPKEIIKKITPKTKAILITHMWGNPCNMDEVIKIKEKHNLFLLEDCSHAHGGKYKGKTLGTFGDVSSWSLQGQKIITGGEGGILATNNEEIYYRANLLGHYNKRCKDEIPFNNPLYKYSVTGFGLKLRAHPLAIAIANQQFKNLDKWIKQKNIFAKKIISHLRDIPFLSFLNTKNSLPSYYALVIKFDEKIAKISREQFVKALHYKGLVEVDIPNSTSPLDDLPFFAVPENSSKRLKYLNQLFNTNHQKESFPNAYSFYKSIIKIPIWVKPEDENIINFYMEEIKKTSDQALNNSNEFKIQVKLIDVLHQAQIDGVEKYVTGGIVLNAKNEILFLQRSSDDFMGDLVELPSGGVDTDENLLASLKREILEETGIESLDIRSYIGSFDYTSGSGKKARQFNFLIKVKDPQIKLNPQEHSTFFWLKLNDLDDYNISEQTKSIVRKIVDL